MRPFFLTPGLRFNDCVFSEPEPFTVWIPPGCGGLIAVLARDPAWAPKPFRPLFFGEFGNDAHRAQELRRWVHGAQHEYYIAVLPLPFSTSAQRRALRDELAAAYNPVCQPAAAPPADELARKINQLETRQEEQNAQILALLSHIVKWFEPQPVPSQRPIGFRPQLTPMATPAENSRY